MNTATKTAEQRALGLWIGFILMFFVLQAILWTTAIRNTAGDSSHSVIPNYDQQALNWDHVKDRKRQSRSLGWACQCSIEPSATETTQYRLRIELKDRKQSPVQAANVKIRLFHRAHSANAQSIKLVERAPGQYSANVTIDHPGKWCIQGSARRNSDTFLIEEILTLTPKR